MTPLPQHIITVYKWCRPLLLCMTFPPSLTRRSALTEMVCGRLGRSSAFIRVLCPPWRVHYRLTVSWPIKVSLSPLCGVWTDNTDSICDLPSVLTFLDNFTSKRYRTNSTSSSPVTGRCVRWASNGVTSPSSLSSSSSLLQASPTTQSPGDCTCVCYRNLCGHPLSPRGPRRQPHKVRIFLFPLWFIRHGVSFWT